MSSTNLDSILKKLMKVEDIRVKPIISDFFISPHLYEGFDKNYVRKDCKKLLSYVVQKMRVSSNVNLDLFLKQKVAIVSGISESFSGKSLALRGWNEAIPFGQIFEELEAKGYERIIFDVASLVKVEPVLFQTEKCVGYYI